MVNVNITLYLTDEDYANKFLPQKAKVFARMREIIKKELGIVKKE